MNSSVKVLPARNRIVFTPLVGRTATVCTVLGCIIVSCGASLTAEPYGSLMITDLRTGQSISLPSPRRGHSEGERRVDLDRCCIRGGLESRPYWSHLRITRSVVKKMDVYWATIGGSSFSGVRFRGCWFKGCRMGGSTWLGCHMYEGSLERCTMRRASIRYCLFQRCNLIRVDLTWSDLRGSKFIDSNFFGAVLFGSQMSGVVLRGSRFDRAVLQNADLRGADLRGARLNGADLWNADLRGARLEGATYSVLTRWPAGVNPARRGAVQEDASDPAVYGAWRYGIRVPYMEKFFAEVQEKERRSDAAETQTPAAP